MIRHANCEHNFQLKHSRNFKKCKVNKQLLADFSTTRGLRGGVLFSTGAAARGHLDPERFALSANQRPGGADPAAAERPRARRTQSPPDRQAASVLVASGLSGEIYPPMQHPSSLLTGAMPVHRVMFFGLAGRSRGWGKMHVSFIDVM